MGFTLFMSIFYIIGFGLLGFGIHSLIQGQRAKSWPVVEARMIDCKLDENSDSEGNTWKVNVRYRYTVAGHEFEGDKIAFGYCGSSAQEAHQTVYEKLKAASAVTVRYDPKNPSNAVLATGLNQSTKAVLVFAIVWLGFTTGFTTLCAISNGKDSRILDQIRVVESR